MVEIKEIINLTTANNRDKYNALRAAGFDTEAIQRGNKMMLRLIDNNTHNIDNCVHDEFRDINEVMKNVSSYILKVGYKVVS